MKAISLWQPWASLVAKGAKHYETRHWKTAHRGVTAIHAAQRFQTDERELCKEWPFSEVIKKPDSLPLGAIVGIGHLKEIITTEEWLKSYGPDSADFREVEYHFGNYEPGRFAWLFDWQVELSEPVRCRGFQQIWELTPEQKRSVEDQFMKDYEESST